MGTGPTACPSAAPPLFDGNTVVADTGAEKRTISLDAKRRRLHGLVSLQFTRRSFLKESIPYVVV